MADFGKDLDNKLAQHDKNYQVEHDSIRSETHILNQHLEEVKSLHVATEKRIVEMDAGNQQLLENFLEWRGIWMENCKVSMTMPSLWSPSLTHWTMNILGVF